VTTHDPFIDHSYMVCMFQYDSTLTNPMSQSRLRPRPRNPSCHLHLAGQKPTDIKWGDVLVEYVVEYIGVFTTMEKAEAHLKSGEKKVIIPIPFANAPMFVMGVKHEKYDNFLKIIINAFCINCLAPLAKVIHDNFDMPSKRLWYYGRRATQNIIPASVGIARAMGKAIAELNGKLTGMVFHVSTPSVLVMDLICCLEKVVKQASEGPLNETLGYTDQVVSCNFNSDTHSSIFDAEAGITLSEHFVKLISGYNNELATAMWVVGLYGPHARQR
uniref:Glyceraldehyde-3-phosphate dehydrogenase n=1 Tax=Mustela putorius furo TaxID=9669 RepID=M3YRM2_MUSPF